MTLEEEEDLPELADHATIARCEHCGAIHIFLHDAEGFPFAEMQLEGDVLKSFTAELVAQAAALARSDTIGTVAGHA